MEIYKAERMEDFKNFPRTSKQLAILERSIPVDAGQFFQKLMKTSVGFTGRVSASNTEKDIRQLLGQGIPLDIQKDPFFDTWVGDMSQVSRSFCETLGEEAVDFSLSSERGCRRYHIDNVPLRALVTYSGQGTEYLPDEAADRMAFSLGGPNEEILKDPTARRYLRQWDVAVFKGGPQGLLHRTPDAALEGPSILLRLDHPSFYDSIRAQVSPA